MQIRRWANFILTIAMGLAISGLSACSTVSNFVWPPGKVLDWKSLTVTAATNANLNTAIAVELVLVMDESLMPAITTMPAVKWFALRPDLLRTYPKALKTLQVEIAPGQTIKFDRETIGTERVLGAFVFADYLTPGEHRARVDMLSGQVMAELGERAFTTSAIKL